MILAIVQARMTSQRLPGKVMMQVKDKPLIWYLLMRLKHSTLIDKIILAAPVDSQNDGLCQYVEGLGFDVFRGSEHDVLERYYLAAEKYQMKTIVRITADCPLIDAKLVDRVIQLFNDGKYDYVSNVEPRLFPDGLDTEVFTFESLQKAFFEAKSAQEREHVTIFMRQNPQFKRMGLKAREDYSKERWTVDYPEDFVLVKDIIENLLSKDLFATMEDILKYKNQNPHVFRVNEHLVP